MRIVDVCAFYSPFGGGVRTYVDAKLKAGPQFGHEIVILAPGERRRTEYRGEYARIEFIPAAKLSVDRRYHYFDNRAALHAALDEFEPDHLEVSSPWRSPSFITDWDTSVPRSLIMHCDPLSAYAYRWFERIADHRRVDRLFGRFWNHLRQLGREFDMVICASRSLAKRLSNGGVQGVVTNPMGVEPGIFSPRRCDGILRREMLARCGLGEEAKLLIGVGRMSAEKRWPMIVESCIAAGFEREIGLVLIGDGSQARPVQSAICGNPHIQLLQPLADRDDFARILASGDILVHGCEAETFCMIAAEARASGLPLIVPDFGGAYDQARSESDEIYSAADALSATRGILRATDAGFVERKRNAVELASNVRCMNAHFADLFASYSSLSRRTRHAA